MASASFAAGRPGEGAVELARLVERCLRGSGALDLEALVVLPGRKVHNWINTAQASQQLLQLFDSHSHCLPAA